MEVLAYVVLAIMLGSTAGNLAKESAQKEIKESVKKDCLKK